MMNRRDVLRLGGGMLGAGTLVSAGLKAGSASANPLSLKIQPATAAITGVATRDMVSLSPDAPPPVIRMKQGAPFIADVTNMLPDYTAMHWHGIRVPNNMDGVPYLTQMPFSDGETHRYEFTSFDAGTYWYHPHCMTMNQMARGLTGVLVVDEAEDPGFDHDLSVNLRDFRLGEDGQFINFFTPRGAARAGTLGTVKTANWQTGLVQEAAPGSLVRLRVVATDLTRIYKLYLDGAEGRIIAADGHPLLVPVPWPTFDAPYLLSPGQRIDIALKMPVEEGKEVILQEARAGGPLTVSRIIAVGTPAPRDFQEVSALPPNAVPEPDLANAETHEFVFGWAPSDKVPNNGFCGSFGFIFWSINRTPWPGDADPGVGPLAVLKQGKSYILRLRNESPNRHPIHLHGLVFKPIRSNMRDVLPNWTDTALLLKGETMDIALVADNPGDWAFHCHVIEHQKAGLAGFIRVA